MLTAKVIPAAAMDAIVTVVTKREERSRAMLHQVDFYYFSPTGGTKRAGEAITAVLAESVNAINLAEKTLPAPASDVVVVAVPVFGGRIPALVSDRLGQLKGMGKKAVTAVVYGVRAYEDALLELNDVMTECGFKVIASAALIAQHSIVPEVGAGRPDVTDIAEIGQFAKRVLDAMENSKTGTVTVPGNHPYKESKKSSAAPATLDSCGRCGFCVSVCPTEAITLTDAGVMTDAEKCMMCMACVAKCPVKARILPPPVQEGLNQKLGVFRDVRRENEFFE